MNNSVPKQFIPLHGKPILMHTIEKFHSSVPEINIAVVLANYLNEQWKELCVKHDFTIAHQLINGGETRFHSVQNGLNNVPDNCIVGIHDAARPLVSKQTILNTFKTATEKGNASPAISLNESIRVITDDKNKAVDRNRYMIIQTPQCFQSAIIKKAFEQEYHVTFTDDAIVLEKTGEKINLVEGNRENIKITTSQDLFIAEALMQGRGY